LFRRHVQIVNTRAQRGLDDGYGCVGEWPSAIDDSRSARQRPIKSCRFLHRRVANTEFCVYPVQRFEFGSISTGEDCSPSTLVQLRDDEASGVSIRPEDSNNPT